MKASFALLGRVLDRLCAHDFADIFLEPLPVDEIDGYSLVVKRPMDVGTVRKRACCRVCVRACVPSCVRRDP